MTKICSVWSESGGVGKTTTAVSLAMLAAEAGHRALLVDLDPRAASTKWLEVAPHQQGYHVGAILAAEIGQPDGSQAACGAGQQSVKLDDNLF